MPSPLTVTFVQATFLNALSNLMAQLIDQRKNTTPFALNTVALLQFIIYGILTVPINFYWQRGLEARYPGFPSRAEIGNAFRCSSRSCSLASFFRSIRSFFRSLFVSSDEVSSAKDKEKNVLWTPRSKQSGLYSFAMKFLLDQTVAGVMNITLFIVLIHLLKGETFKRVWELLLEDVGPIMIARLKYRPVVSTLMYTVVPVDRRVVFGSASGVIWGVYLSLYAAV